MNCFYEKTATTMTMYINCFQKEKETSLLFSVAFWFVVEINDLKSGITEQNPSVTLDEV